ncbi:MAG: Peptide methionine sulfoxide reductase MsrA [Hyphomicrobiaceae bacterium hypho_1]
MIDDRNYILNSKIKGSFAENIEIAIFGMGCFWGAEKLFRNLGSDKIWTTSVGYTAGFTSNPSYEEVCSGNTGHSEVVLIAFDPSKTSYENLLKIFWEGHNPTQGMRQGNDIGAQYRSGIYYTSPEQCKKAIISKNNFQKVLTLCHYGLITTEIVKAGLFHYAEDYHQQYLTKQSIRSYGFRNTGLQYQYR